MVDKIALTRTAILLVILSMKLFFPLVFVLISFSARSANSQVTFDQIDAKTQLLQQSKLSPNNTGIYLCPGKCKRGAFCAAYYCTAKLRLSKIKIAEIIKIDYSYPRAADVPVHRTQTTISIDNCFSTPWLWEEKVTHNTNQIMESKTTSILRNVASREIELTLDAQVLEELGVKVTEKFSRSTTIEATTNEVNRKIQTFTIEQPLKMKVPSLTRRIIRYSDGRTTSSIFADIELLLDGYVQEVDESSDKWPKKQKSKVKGMKGNLSELVKDRKKRSITIRAKIDVSGSDRKLKIVLEEMKIESGVSGC